MSFRSRCHSVAAAAQIWPESSQPPSSSAKVARDRAKFGVENLAERCRGSSAEIGAGFGQTPAPEPHTDLARWRPNLARFGPMWTNTDRTRPTPRFGIDPSWPVISAKRGPVLQIRPGTDTRHRPSPGPRRQAELGPSSKVAWADCGQAWAGIDRCWSEFGRAWAPASTPRVCPRG